jgi:conjugative relaxase-like TrwC/TraI family protein
MISKFEVPSGGQAAAYHDKAFANDGAGVTADNYYANDAAPATWQGKGAEILGIEGQLVKRADFIAFLDGKLPNPTTGVIQNLADNSRGADRRAGWDFTVSAPKSVSIVGLVGQDARVMAAHQTANAKALGWLETHGALMRVKDDLGANVKEQTGNLLYATVQHETSRANEPQLHNHNVIVAATFDAAQDKWRSLTNDEIFNLRTDADAIYKAALGKELKLAGYELVYDANGVDFEIKGLSAAQLGTYSSRTQQIDEALRARGFDPESASWAARQAAALNTRAKKVELPREVLHEVWREKAQEAGLDVAHLVENSLKRAQELGSMPEGTLQNQAREAAITAVSWAVEHLSEREQSFKRSELEATAVKFSRSDIDDVKGAIETHITNHLLVERAGMPGGADWLTTHKGITSELNLRENILEGKGVGRTVLASEQEFKAAVRAFEDKKTAALVATGGDLSVQYKLSAEQVNAARNILMHGDVYQGIQGAAGSGKTAALELVREVAQSKGWRVMGMATSASAAKELQASSGIESQTVAGFFVERDNAIRSATIELNELRQARDEGVVLRSSDAPRIAVLHLSASTGDLNFGRNRYVIDHERAEVFRSGTSVANRLGNYLVDVSNSYKNLLEPDQNGKVAGDRPETLGHRLHAQLMSGVADAAGALGRSLESYEKVGVVESIAARKAVYVQDPAAKAQINRQINIKEAELDSLQRTGNTSGQQTLLVMDESSMTGAQDAQKISALARDIGARVVFQGDVDQHASVPAGRFFAQAQRNGLHVSTLAETRRFDKATQQTKTALAEMKIGNYAGAIAVLDRVEVSEGALSQTVATRYLSNLTELKDAGKVAPQVGVVVLTNRDRKAFNETIHTALQSHGLIDKTNFTKAHLDDPRMTGAEQRHASMLAKNGVNRLIFRKGYKEIGVTKGEVVVVTGFDIEKNLVLAVKENGRQISFNPSRQDYFSPALAEQREFAVGDKVESRAILKFEGKGAGISKAVSNGTRGTIASINDQGATVAWDDGVKSVLNNKQMQFVDLAYAHTTYKEQGATTDREIIAVSETGAKIFNRLAAYVAASRARGNTELVTSDFETLMKTAGRDVQKTTSVGMDLRALGTLEGLEHAMRAVLQERGQKDAGGDLEAKPPIEREISAGKAQGPELGM